MNERVFLAFRGLAILIHCFPGLGPSERHTTMRFVLACRSEAGSPLDRHLQGKGPIPFTQKLQRTSPICGGYSTVQDTSLWLTRRWPNQGCWQVLPLWALKTCLLNGYIGRVYLPLAVPRFRFTYVSLDLLSRSPPYSRPFPVLPRTARCCWTGGDLGGGLGALVLRETYVTRGAWALHPTPGAVLA